MVKGLGYPGIEEKKINLPDFLLVLTVL